MAANQAPSVPNSTTKPAQLVQTADGWSLVGDWTLANRRALVDQLAKVSKQGTLIGTLDVSQLGAMDTSGAQLLLGALRQDSIAQLTHEDSALPEAQRALITLVASAQPTTEPAHPTKGSNNVLMEGLAFLGSWVVIGYQHALEVLGFMGLTLEGLAKTALRPSSWRFTSFVANLEQAGFKAIPIVASMNFLIGCVVAFLGASILKDFGATLFTVHLVGFSFLREFGPLLTAILVAGRTASAFAAQIGAMRANEEVDAIRVMGIRPIDILVLPRVLALLVGMPLMTFLAMISGLVGGALVCAVSLDISPIQFVSVISSDVKVRHFLIGMAKTPVFAFLIGVIGCLEGFKAQSNARSVGERTTSAVVQSIFTVIVVDALVALFCMQVGW